MSLTSMAVQEDVHWWSKLGDNGRWSSNVPYHKTIDANVYPDSLREYFSQFGEVLECTVMRDGASGRSRGFGFLTFKDAKTINIVMVKEHYLDGKIVRPDFQTQANTLRLYPSKSSSLKKHKGSPDTLKIDPKRAIPRDEQERTSKIFVGGVSQEATEQDFKEFFMQFGRVIDATLMMDKDTGRPRGFGFVTFDSEAAVENCLDRPLEIHGKPIEVKKAQPRGNMREEEDMRRGGPNRFRKGGGDDNQNANQQPLGGGGNQTNPGGMTPQLMAQYWQRMQQYFAMMQQQMAMGRGAGMGGMAGGMNPAMMAQMQQMQAMQAMQQQMQGGAVGRSQSPQSPTAMTGMAGMNPAMMAQMQQMQQMQGMGMGGNGGGGGSGSGSGGGGGGSNAGGRVGTPGYNAYEQQIFEQQKYEQQQMRRATREQSQYGQQGYGGGGGGMNNGEPTSWDGMYEDVPPPNSGGGGGRAGRGGRGSATPQTGPQSAPPANAPTGPKNAGKPGANYRGGGRGGQRGFHPYAR